MNLGHLYVQLLFVVLDVYLLLYLHSYTMYIIGHISVAPEQEGHIIECGVPPLHFLGEDDQKHYTLDQAQQCLLSNQG